MKSLVVLLALGCLVSISARASADYVEDRAAAVGLMKKGKYEAALNAFVGMAAGKITPFQKSDALELAAECARHVRAFEQADKLAGQIPLEPVAKTVQMQNLLALRKQQELLDQFKSEDLTKFPFWKAGDAFYVRGRAWSDTDKGKEAETDLNIALEYLTDGRARADAWLALAMNRERNLKDDAGALEAFQQIANMTRFNGSATYFRGIQGANRILRKQGKLNEALAVLKKVQIKGRRGFWHGALLLDLASTLSAAGRIDEARLAYKELLADKTVSPAHRTAAQAALKSLQK